MLEMEQEEKLKSYSKGSVYVYRQTVIWNSRVTFSTKKLHEDSILLLLQRQPSWLLQSNYIADTLGEVARVNITKC